MTELIWSGAVFLIAFTAIVTASKIIRKKNKPVITFENNNIIKLNYSLLTKKGVYYG